MADDTMYFDRPARAGRVTTGWVLREGKSQCEGAYLVGVGAWNGAWPAINSRFSYAAKVYRTRREACSDASMLLGGNWRAVRLYRKVR